MRTKRRDILKQDLAVVKVAIMMRKEALEKIEQQRKLNISEAQRESNECYFELFTNQIEAFEKKQRYIESQLQSLLEKGNGHDK
ncbi:hypothetical protein P4U71_27615 [Bacillus pacificus]|uniref:hypothetical protein n=1 Tax=Bacillus cereus group TaxID=86661 RepID=UPI0022E132CE|nr:MULTISPECIES: hypothetical protein [Bacillus cereus group]MDA2738872.1 hypothetical protein [Bacillus cereus group sp. Bc015]MED1588403.1 hypothetical protein [Bacillus pacificus]